MLSTHPGKSKSALLNAWLAGDKHKGVLTIVEIDYRVQAITRAPSTSRVPREIITQAHNDCDAAYTTSTADADRPYPAQHDTAVERLMSLILCGRAAVVVVLFSWRNRFVMKVRYTTVILYAFFLAPSSSVSPTVRRTSRSA